ncbi:MULTISPECIES: hypothetical protein [Burkholderia]|uniref:hypothetical protein n=1 Tax=Burkholderia TaxID=32008 RepID=UPI000AA462EA|nr:MULTISPECIES: hypothetical protein [Burkholderia]
MDIYDILENAPLFVTSEPARSCLLALERFLSENSVVLSAIDQKFSAHSAIRWGLPLTFIEPNAFSRTPFLSRFAKPFSLQGELNIDDFSELQAASLLLGVGAASVEPVGRTHEKTHDLNVTILNEPIEVEVTRSQKKAKHIELSQQATEIASHLHSIARPFDLVVHLLDILTPETRTRLYHAANTIGSEDMINEESSWHLRSKPIARAPHEIFTAGEKEETPDWWPTDAVKLFTLSQTLAGPEAKEAPPRVKVCYTAPFSGYLNSAKKKARNFQGTVGNPYLVVIDANNLPNPFDAFQEGLNPLFPRWRHISGVIVFEDYRTTDEIGWTLQLYRNPFANRPLPAGFLGGAAASGAGPSRLVRSQSKT